MTDLASAYVDSAGARSGPDVSRVERALLCDTLDRVGPSSPTLCEGWDTHHLVAHLRGRESGNPLRVAIAAYPPLGDRSVEDIAAKHGFDDMVADLRSGPPRLSLFRLPGLEPRLNVLEFFVHHEDVRRAAAGWEARVLPRWAQDQIWGRVVGLAKLSQRRAKSGVVLERNDTTERVQVSGGDDVVMLRGLPSELALYLSGRTAVSDVEVLGSPPAVEAFEARA